MTPRRLVHTLMVAAVFAGSFFAPSAAAGERKTRVSECGTTATETDHTYIFTKDLVCPSFGIRAAAPNVRIDLGGHTLYGLGTANGVEFVSGAATGHAEVRNGRLEGFKDGISAPLSLAMARFRISNVRMVDNVESGAEFYALKPIVEGSVATSNGSTGIAIGTHADLYETRVTDTVATLNGGAGIRIVADDVILRNIRANENGQSVTDSGIEIEGTRVSVSSSSASDNTFTGINVTGDDALVRGVHAKRNRIGVLIRGDRSRVLNSVASDNTGVGIYINDVGERARIDDNRANNNGWGSAAEDAFGIYAAGYDATGKNVARRNNGTQCDPATLC